MVYSLTTYADPVWSGYPGTTKDALDSLQRRLARWVIWGPSGLKLTADNKYREVDIGKLGWFKWSDKHRCHLAGRCWAYFNNPMFPACLKLETSDELKVMDVSPATALAKRTFQSRAHRIWNGLSEEVKTAKTLDKFRELFLRDG